MKKRAFLKMSGVVAAGALITPLVTSCGSETDSKDGDIATGELFVAELPKLAYEYNALEPYIDAQTMEIHHSKHHAGYTKKFNAALEGSTGMNGKSVKEILSGLTDAETTTGIRNNGGGFYNHELFWSIMAPNAGGMPTGDVANAIDAAFGSFDKFQEEFSDAAKGVFGSGWAWLCKDDNDKLFVTSTPNQDNPLMTNLVEKAGQPILGLDVWEHAYYLKYQNMRGDYISNFFNVVNWNAVAERLKG
ncbi:MAG: superoxide dismutase [Saprospiraceae bacterium]